eukprot:jgi/Botrbrau1/11887/Bobra.126_2s0020.1
MPCCEGRETALLRSKWSKLCCRNQAAAPVIAIHQNLLVFNLHALLTIQLGLEIPVAFAICFGAGGQDMFSQNLPTTY